MSSTNVTWCILELEPNETLTKNVNKIRHRATVQVKGMQGVKGGCKPSIMNAKFQEALIRSGMVNIAGMEKG